MMILGVLNTPNNNPLSGFKGGLTFRICLFMDRIPREQPAAHQYKSLCVLRERLVSEVASLSR